MESVEQSRPRDLSDLAVKLDRHGRRNPEEGLVVTELRLRLYHIPLFGCYSEAQALVFRFPSKIRAFRAG